MLASGVADGLAERAIAACRTPGDVPSAVFGTVVHVVRTTHDLGEYEVAACGPGRKIAGFKAAVVDKVGSKGRWRSHEQNRYESGHDQQGFLSHVSSGVRVWGIPYCVINFSILLAILLPFLA